MGKIMLKNLSNAVRALSVDMVVNANSGHLGLPLGMADCVTELFRNHMRFSAKNPNWPNRDRFILSGGHGSALLYSILHLCGYEKFSIETLKNFRKFNSLASGHPEYDVDAGVEMTTGPLGQGIATAVGMAIAERILNNRLGNDVIDHFTYVCAGDGDLMEGISHEACSIAGTLGLGKLIVLYDNNKVTVDGYTNITCNDDVSKRFESYGWHVINADGHDEQEISNAIFQAKINEQKPSIIIFNTKIGYGTDFECSNKAHSGILNEQQVAEFKQKIGVSQNAFCVNEDSKKEWSDIGSKGDQCADNWFSKYSDIFDNIKEEQKAAFKKVFRSFKKEFFVSRPYEATRSISQRIITELCLKSNFVISGSCDLGTSTGCMNTNSRPIKAGDFSGNYIHYGVREHAMGAIINGITLHGGLIAFGGAFLAFSDYMKPAIRLAAMMNIPSIFVFSHDSIGVGEDGPTHQPVEHIAGLRSIPNLNVFRPADALETSECWETALNLDNPSVLVLTRQKVLSVRFCGRDNLCSKGGYLLYEDSTNNKNSITIVATGSEVGIALEVRSMLMKKNISVNIVSMPSLDIFEKQPDSYKKEVLGKSQVIVIEAASEFGWHKYYGDNGMFFGVNNFGKSAECIEIFNFFNLNSNNIVHKVLKKYGY